MVINATKKGLITGLLMVCAGILMFWKDVPLNSPLQYIGFLIFGAGIVWAVYAAAKWSGARFGTLFNQGFRCFVVVALIMSVYTFIFWKANPEIINKNIAETKAYLLKNPQDRTPAEIEEQAKNTLKYYIPIKVSGSVFGYLLTGVVVTTVVAGILSLSKKN
ncbi:DUF4199 family protein [Niabella aurantiaca]|uniref:DUF4199 family protein n=1 Tax=Niabella aurantiaca TaxID=379900 RepID=UPI000371F144|nr:DUF4199 family protein [Niabella aurantiaca]